MARLAYQCEGQLGALVGEPPGPPPARAVPMAGWHAHAFVSMEAEAVQTAPVEADPNLLTKT